jgi:hypothetical protein
MSAIGSYALVSRADFPTCLARARQVHTETSGKWVFKKSQTVGIEEFKKAWQAALVREVDFDYSGYVIGNYLDAQSAVNEAVLIDEHSEVSTALSKVFTAGFPFEAPVALPELQQEKLFHFCREEYGEDDAAGMVEAINAAHSFYQRGLGEITPEHLVVFIIR